jgi:hypothetical protein
MKNDKKSENFNKLLNLKVFSYNNDIHIISKIMQDKESEA